MIQIIDYGAGNLASIQNALEKLGAVVELIRSPRELKDSAKIVFAGVGAAGAAMASLKKSGFDLVLPKLKNPFLGICLGMQVLFEYSQENGTKCLGILKGEVRRFPFGMLVPQIGWNQVRAGESKLFEGIGEDSCFYFVNSYVGNAVGENVIAVSEYEISFAAAVRKGNFYGVQFHPEKSGAVGEKLLNNFIELC